MHKGQLARLPQGEGRRVERRVVNLAASLREPGAEIADIEVLNLSADGFMAACPLDLEVGHTVYLKLPGREAQKSKVAWIDGNQAGFEFAAPLHPATLQELVAEGKPVIRRNHFGPRGR